MNEDQPLRNTVRVLDMSLRENPKVTDFKTALVLQKLIIIINPTQFHTVHQFSPEPGSFGGE